MQASTLQLLPGVFIQIFWIWICRRNSNSISALINLFTNSSASPTLRHRLTVDDQIKDSNSDSHDTSNYALMIPFASLMMVVAEMQSPRKRTINLTLCMPISIIVGVTNSVTMAKVESLTSDLKKGSISRRRFFGVEFDKESHKPSNSFANWQQHCEGR